MDIKTGKVIYPLIGRLTTAALVRFYHKVRHAYPQASRIWVVQDNWPVQLHPEVLVALEPQERLYPVNWSPSWKGRQGPSPSALRRAAKQAPLPIQIVQLPTYASWCNPIEKLWRKLKQEVMHLHRWAADLPQLRDRIRAFLAGYADGSLELLRYVGLSSN